MHFFVSNMVTVKCLLLFVISHVSSEIPNVLTILCFKI